MRPTLVWLILLACSAIALWQLQSDTPILPPAATGLLLLLIGIIGGLRWGSDSAAAYLREVGILNRYLAEQNQDLAEVNHLLLKQTLLEREFDEEPSSQSARSEDA